MSIPQKEDDYTKECNDRLQRWAAWTYGEGIYYLNSLAKETLPQKELEMCLKNAGAFILLRVTKK